MATTDSLTELFNLLGKGNTTKSSGGTTTETKEVSKETTDALLKQALESNGGLASLLGQQAGAGMYNSTVNQQMINDLLARVTSQIAAQTSKTVRTTSPSKTTTGRAPLTGKDYAGLLVSMVGKQKADGFLKSKDPVKYIKDLFSSNGAETSTGASAGTAPGYGVGINGASSGVGLNANEDILSAISPEFNGGSSGIVTTPDATWERAGETGTALVGTNTAVNGLNTSQGVAELNTAGQAATTEGTFGTAEANYDVLNTKFDSYSEGTNTASESSSGSAGSYLGAITGAMSGYAAGKKNYYEDERMQSGEDGFGKYHHDARAEVGGAVLGGVMGYYGSGVGSGLAAPVVDLVHPFAENLTRDFITTADDIGGSNAAITLDPLGSIASGKYSDNETVAVGLTNAMGIPIPDATESVTNFLDDNCFITTAVCSHLNRGDNCFELETLRSFRDTWMKDHGLQAEIDEYYVKAPEIVRKLSARPDRNTIFNSFYRQYIVPAVDLITSGKQEEAYRVYKKLFWLATDLAGV